MKTKYISLVVYLMILVSSWLCAAELKVAALHPLMADLAKNVGAGRVEIFDLVGEGGNPHRYEPRPSDMKKLSQANVVLATGKNAEAYLDRLRQTIPNINIIEVGRTIPSLSVGKDAVYQCCEHHSHGSIDPHWWQSVANMGRAAKVVAQAFSAADPAGKSVYEAAAKDYSKRMDALKKWVTVELKKVPREQRKLVTAHNAFGYFAKENGYQVIPVAGITSEQNISPKDLATVIEAVKKSGVKALFPEQNTNRKMLDAIAKATGCKIAPALISDGNGKGKLASFEEMVKHNVSIIAPALAH